MKLYFYPGACSLAPHIVLREAGFEFELDQVDLAAKRTEGGEDFTAVNPKGSVPALRLDNGEILTEVAVILQYLADLKPGAKLAPPAGSFERVRLQEWLNYVATEIHKGQSAVFNPKLPDAWKEVMKEMVSARFDFLSARLKGAPYLMGGQFTIADAYLYTVLNWTTFLGLDLAQWPALKAYSERVASRPTVQAALKAEGLVT